MKDGGPAFPYDNKSDGGEHGFKLTPSSSGMSLRDYFAAHAPFTLADAMEATKRICTEATYEVAFRWLAQMRFHYADFMIKQREVNNE